MLLKKINLIFLLVSLMFLKNAANKVNYCSPEASCNSIPHTICKLKHDCSVNLQNCKQYEQVLLSDSDKKLLVDTHNKYRNLVATGAALPGLGGQMLPTASDMAEMVWDKELEFISQCWANQCTWAHDKCRSKSDGLVVGQNLGMSDHNDLAGAIEGFYEEIRQTKKSDIIKLTHSEYVIGHFTQLVYYNSTQIGCGRIKYFYAKWKTSVYYLVCNYAIAGNLLETKVYTKGKPCASCPGKCHETYKGLCKTPQSFSEIPDICSHSSNSNCQSILNNASASNNYKSDDQQLYTANNSQKLFSYFGTKLSISAITFTVFWLYFHIF